MERDLTPPVSEGEVISLECISIGKKGDGIFKHERFVIIAPNTEVGKTYELKITKVLRQIAFAEITKDSEVPESSESFGEEEDK